jgi:hypothetical protein
MTSQTIVPQAQPIESHRSAGLATMVNDLISSHGAVLDLGPLSSGTTEIFLKKGCKCYVEDVGEIFPYLDIAEENFKSLLEDHLLPKDASLKFDAILCWDLLNYLHLSSIKILFQTLDRHMKPGTQVHLMHYTGARMPAMPSRFMLTNNFNYDVLSSHSHESIPSLGHTTVSLLKNMGQFDLTHSHVNQEGMHKNVKEMIVSYDTAQDRVHSKTSDHSLDVSYFATDKVPFQCPALSSYLSDAERLANITILDLGRRSGRDTQYLNQASHRLYIEDVFSSLSWRVKIDEKSNQPLNIQVLKKNEPATIDLVLAWDIFNYCSPMQIQQFDQLMASKMVSGGHLHFIVYREYFVPKKPVVFNIESSQDIQASGEFSGTVTRQFSTTANLMKLLPNFIVKKFHYGHSASGESYQEYLLVKK